MSIDLEALAASVVALHAEKHAAYGPAWKKRGEVLSILANIARKVDRLEAASMGAGQLRGETMFDTAIDLFVYELKYLTFLAEWSPQLSARFVARGVRPPFSDGTIAFEALVAIAVENWEAGETPDVPREIERTSRSFAVLESAFSGTAATVPVEERAARVDLLVVDTTALILALAEEDPGSFGKFCARAGESGANGR